MAARPGRRERQEKAKQERERVALLLVDLYLQELALDGSREHAWTRLEARTATMKDTPAQTLVLARAMVHRALESLSRTEKKTKEASLKAEVLKAVA